MLLWTFLYFFVCEPVLSFLLGICLVIELLTHVVTMSNFWGAARLFSKEASPFYIPVSCIWRFQFVHALTNTCMICPVNYSHSSGYEVVLIVLWFALSRWLMMLSIFSCAYWPFVYLLWELSCQSFAYVRIALSFSLLSCKSSSCLLDTSFLSDMWLANIFFHSVSCLSPFWRCPMKHKSFKFWYILFYLFFFAIFKKPLLFTVSGRFIPLFSSKNIIVLAPTFGYLIHFEDIHTHK